MVAGRKREAEGGWRPAIQNFGVFFATGVAPQSDKGLAGAATSSLQLSPGYYSLGVEGNVPFVILKGPSRMQKPLSWGETIAIPEGMQATLFNASYHPGDIVLKGGQDWPVGPRRITVPVDFDAVSGGVVWTITPKWPVDVRRARQAFLVWRVTVSAPVNVGISGDRVKGSHFTQSPKPGYLETLVVPAGPFVYVPLGYGAAPPPIATVGLLPHALLDTALVLPFAVLKADVPAPLGVPMYYVVEY